MPISRRHIILVLGIATFIQSCTGLKAVKEGEYLYTGMRVAVQDSALTKKDRQKVERHLEEQSGTKPNGTLLWMRPGLSVYAMVKKTKKEKGFRNWLKYKIGKEPVLLQQLNPVQIEKSFQNKLYHKGLLHNTVSSEVKKSQKTASVDYKVITKNQYRFNELEFLSDSIPLARFINPYRNESLIRKGENYDLNVIKSERSRIQNGLLDEGFHFFKPDQIYYAATKRDSSHQVDLKLRLKEDVLPYSNEIFTLKDIYVHDDYGLDSLYTPDTTMVDGYHFLSQYHSMRPEILLNQILIKPGERFNRSRKLNSISQLVGMRSFRFVNIQYFNEDYQRRTLDARVILVPQKKFSLVTELNATVKTNNFAGPGVKFNFLSRNIFGGGEFLSLNVTGRYEVQIIENEDPINAYEINSEAGIIIPRIVPFQQRKENRQYRASTKINTSLGFSNRVNLYRFTTGAAGLSYTWRKRTVLSHTFKPIDVSITNLSDASAEFIEYLNQNPSIRRSLERQYIFGTAYEFQFNNQSNKNFSYFGGVDAAGNLLDLMTSSPEGQADSVSSKTIFGVPFTQFFRFRNDIRYQFKLGKKSRIATRLIASAGIPYGNSSVMPYVRQFFVGGTNSVRAFRARSVGPGEYAPPDSLNNLLVDQSGDIKLEANVEFRFPLIKSLKGALFVDAGNIWLVNEDENRPGSDFDVDNFYKQIAMGVGYGLRYDIEVLVLRFDWAFPIYKPSLPEGERWVIDEVDFFNNEWRNQNIILNISIGYPF